MQYTIRGGRGGGRKGKTREEKPTEKNKNKNKNKRTRDHSRNKGNRTEIGLKHRAFSFPPKTFDRLIITLQIE